MGRVFAIVVAILVALAAIAGTARAWVRAELRAIERAREAEFPGPPPATRLGQVKGGILKACEAAKRQAEDGDRLVAAGQAADAARAFAAAISTCAEVAAEPTLVAASGSLARARPAWEGLAKLLERRALVAVDREAVVAAADGALATWPANRAVMAEAVRAERRYFLENCGKYADGPLHALDLAWSWRACDGFYRDLEMAARTDDLAERERRVGAVVDEAGGRTRTPLGRIFLVPAETYKRRARSEARDAELRAAVRAALDASPRSP